MENFREKEKSEIKDRKVLEVLQIKDDRIEELQHVLTQKTRELTELAIRLVKTFFNIAICNCQLCYKR